MDNYLKRWIILLYFRLRFHLLVKSAIRSPNVISNNFFILTDDHAIALIKFVGYHNTLTLQ